MYLSLYFIVGPLTDAANPNVVISTHDVVVIVNETEYVDLQLM